MIVTNLDGQTHNLYRNLGEGLFEDATFSSGVGEPTLPFVGFGATFLDYDNDGHLDLAIGRGDVLDNASYFRPAALSTAQPAAAQHGRRPFRRDRTLIRRGFALVKVTRALHAGDIDNDGDLDLGAVNNGQRADLFRNDGGNRANALIVRTIGTRSNRDGVGAVLRLTAGGRIGAGHAAHRGQAGRRTMMPPLRVLAGAAVLATGVGLTGSPSGASTLAIKLIDMAQQAGLTLLNICGGFDKNYIVDVNGNGAAWLDYSHGAFAGVEEHSAPGPAVPPGRNQSAAIQAGDEAHRSA